MRVGSWLRALGVMLVVLVTAGPHADAQQGDALQFFQQNPGSSRFFWRSQPERAAPRPQPRDSSAPRRVRPPASEPADTAVARDADRPAVPPSVFVHVIGDSLAELLAQGLKEHMTDRPDVAFLKAGRTNSGLVRDDYFDWVKAARELAASPDPIDLVVVMIGSNDRQALREEGGTAEFRSDRWREVYVRRIDAVLEAFRQRRVPLLWVGMPVMQSQRLSADMLHVNDLFRERVTRAGFAYADVWEGFSDGQGQYAAVGPDVSGEMVRLRTADGVHFTRAGARKLGFFVSREVTRLIARDRPGIELAALPAEPARPGQPEATPLVPTIPPPEDAPLVPLMSLRPLSGPIQPLTAPPVSPGGALARGRPYSPANEATITRERTLTYGLAPVPKAGRADDHRWPRDESP
jgi:hypothetical protein